MFRLALALGRTVGELMQTISSDELTEWSAFYRLDPFGDLRQDMQAALIASTLANVHAPKGTSYTMADFKLSFHRPEPPVLSQAETHQFLKRMLGHG